MACMSPVLEKVNLIGEAPGQRPGDVLFPNMYNGEGCAADIAVTCLCVMSMLGLLTG